MTMKRRIINRLVERLAQLSYWIERISENVMMTAEWLNDYHGDGRDDEHDVLQRIDELT